MAAHYTILEEITCEWLEVFRERYRLTKNPAIIRSIFRQLPKLEREHLSRICFESLCSDLVQILAEHGFIDLHPYSLDTEEGRARMVDCVIWEKALAPLKGAACDGYTLEWDILHENRNNTSVRRILGIGIYAAKGG